MEGVQKKMTKNKSTIKLLSFKKNLIEFQVQGLQFVLQIWILWLKVITFILSHIVLNPFQRDHDMVQEVKCIPFGSYFWPNRRGGL